MTGRRRKPGTMGPFIESFRAWLAERGYSPGTVIGLLAMAGGLGRWMDARGIAGGRSGSGGARGVPRAHVACRECGGSPAPVGWTGLLEFLEQQGVLVTPVLLVGRSR